MPTPPVIFALNGPNLNLLGSREPRIYGTQSLDDIKSATEKRAKAMGVKVDLRQSNHEGELVYWLHEAMAKASAVILNAAAALQIPVIEVRLSNVYAREHFGRQSFVAQVARGSIVGLGPLGYLLALDAAAQLCKGAAANAASRIQ